MAAVSAQTPRSFSRMSRVTIPSLLPFSPSASCRQLCRAKELKADETVSSEAQLSDIGQDNNTDARVGILRILITEQSRLPGMRSCDFACPARFIMSTRHSKATPGKSVLVSPKID